MSRQAPAVTSSTSTSRAAPSVESRIAVVAVADVGQTVRVAVTATNGAGDSVPALSAVTAVVRADKALSQPVLASASEGPTVGPQFANDGNSTTRWSLDGTTFTDAASVSLGAAGWKLTSFAAASARYVRVLGVTRATQWGISFWDAQVFGPADGGGGGGSVPVNSGLPVVSGLVGQGQGLSASVGAWSGSPSSYAFQWQRCGSGGGGCQAIGGAIGSSYVLSVADVGQTVRVAVTATNGAGD